MVYFIHKKGEMKHFKTDTYWMITFDCIDKNGFHHEITRYFTSNRKIEKELKKILTKLKDYQNDALLYYLNHYDIGDLKICLPSLEMLN